MFKKSIVLLAVLAVLITGCSKKNDSEKLNGKDASSELAARLIGIVKEFTDKSLEAIVEETENGDKDEKVTDDSESDESKENEDKTSNEAVTKEKETAKQNTSQSNSSFSSGNQQPSQQQPESGKNDQPQQEQPKPAEPNPEPVAPKPQAPTCNNTIPAGAYPIEREDEIDAKVQAELADNQANGDGTLKGYDVEYGVTECGTSYFYIIYHRY